MTKWHKEPLLHFLVIGALIFFVFSVRNQEDAEVGSKKIVVSAGDIERLQANWSRKWNRSPTDSELEGLIESHIREEVYYREALALGLDQNDTVLRRRLMQKLEFLSNDLAELNVPDETALNEYFLEHQDRYELPARVTFTHIYFSWDKRGVQALKDARVVADELRASSSPISRAPERGDSFMLQYDFTEETPFEVARLFGEDFAGRLFAAETNSWQGPIESGYGFHLVRISAKTDSRMPDLASVIDKVRTDLMFEQRAKMNKEIYERFKERYEIVVEKMSKQSGLTNVSTSGGKAS